MTAELTEMDRPLNNDVAMVLQQQPTTSWMDDVTLR